MKKIIALMMLMIYSVFTAGVTVYSHYCAGKLSSLSILETNSKGCDKCGKDMSKDCCKDAQQKLSLDDSQVKSTLQLVEPDFSGLAIFVPTFSLDYKPEFALVNSNEVKFYVFEKGPPKTPIYIQIRSLLI
jgi:hypothetical protein